MEISLNYNQTCAQAGITKSNATQSDVFKPTFTGDPIPFGPHLRRKRLKPLLELLGYVAFVIAVGIIAGLVLSNKPTG